MTGLGTLGFLSPWILLALAALPAIWWLLRATPPQPQRVAFPATRILKGIVTSRSTPARSPWWLTLIRMLAAAAVILGLAEPVLNPDRGEVAGRAPVVVVVDNGWPAASRWEERLLTVRRLVGEAERAGLPVMIAPTAEPAGSTPPALESPKDALDRLALLQPRPLVPARQGVAEAIAKGLGGATSASIFWLADGLENGGGQDLARRLLQLAGSAGTLRVFLPATERAPLGVRARIGDGGKLEVEVMRPGGSARAVTVAALAGNGLRLGEVRLDLPTGGGRAAGRLDLPAELRNQIARLEIEGERSAGAVHLLDTGARWNRIGLVSGGSREQAQPLLGALYYIERALSPYAELIKSDDANTAAAVEALLKQGATLLVLADIGRLPPATEERLGAFLAKGGVLVRFAGPRMEDGGDELVPVALRLGGRALGGALSWSTPQPLGAFEPSSLFAGLEVPPDVRVTRQVLADPALLTDKTLIWARLADGTPLVTAERREGGWIVLFHVTANSDWSNLPLSGLFVDMLRRISRLTGLADLGGQEAASEAGAADSQRLLQPVMTLDGFGAALPPPAGSEALPAEAGPELEPDATHPPGLYGPPGSARALNALGPRSDLRPLGALPAGAVEAVYRAGESRPLKPLLLGLALALLLADLLAVLALQTFGLGRRAPAAAAVLLGLLAGGLALLPGPARAQEVQVAAPSDAREAFALKAATASHFAYVLTGDRETDETSRQGLTGLGQILEQRTAVEPAEPIGIDVDKDELSFFPILYWPVRPDAQPLSEAALARVDAFMKGGGMIIFDTREQGERLPGLDEEASPAGQALRRLVARLDLPRLEPVPADHVLTKSFYLLRSFPGRFEGSPLWVEASNQGPGEDAERARLADGVSSLVVTGNDLAGAWAIDDSGQPLYAVVPGGEEQREMAYRVGVNIVMYALTGNYKADQVHVPAILERLGQ